ncbi:MAG: ATP-binding protein [Cyanophyceae cyanobacterium]
MVPALELFSPIQRAEEPSLTPTTILIVEDERLVARHLKTVLEFMGYNVLALVASGEEAVEQARSLQPDLVLMDIWLAGELDGIAAAKTMQAHRVPVVFLTAYGDEATLGRAKLTQPYGYVLKPFEERELRVTLEIAVQRALAEERMRQALKKEQELREHQRRFFSMVSHEFRTPLSTILMSAQILEHTHEITSQKIAKNLARIQKSVKRALRLVEDILAINRVAHHQIQVSPQKFDLEKFCQSVIAEAHPETERPPITLDMQCQNQFVCLDKHLLHSILINLCSNAVKYSPADSRITLSVDYQSRLIFLVQDEGIGIPSADLSQVFEPFHRGSNAHPQTGSGLGLTVVKHYVELLGGNIRVNSQVGIGTTFTVTLPLRE